MNRIILVATLSLSLSGCAFMQKLGLDIPSPKTARQAIYTADGAFLGAVTIANDYKALPDCGGVTPICKDAATLDKIRLGANAADATLKAAENTVKDPKFAGSTSDAAIVAATNAVQAFVNVTSVLKTH
jgi:hypothetical protein